MISLRTLKLQNEASRMLVLDCLAVLIRMRDRIDNRIAFLQKFYDADEKDASHTFDSARQAEIFESVGIADYGWSTFLNRRVRGQQFALVKELDEDGKALSDCVAEVRHFLNLAETKGVDG